MKRECNDIFGLEMNLASHVIEHCLADPICTHRKWAHLHSTNTSQGAANSDEFARPLGFLQKWTHGLEENKCSDAVNIDMLPNICHRDLGKCRVRFANTSVSDDNIEVGDVVFGF